MDRRDEVEDLELAREVSDFAPRERHLQPPLPEGVFERLERLLKKICNWATWLAGLALLAMLVLSIADVIGIKIFNTPVPGAPEFIAFLAVLVIAFAMGYTLIERAHIQVDVFVNKFPARLKSFVETLVSLLGFCLFALLAYYSVIYGNQLLKVKEVSMTQHIPFYPFVYAEALACLPVSAYLLMEAVRGFTKMVKR